MTTRSKDKYWEDQWLIGKLHEWLSAVLDPPVERE